MILKKANQIYVFCDLFIQKQTLKVCIVFKMHYINTNIKNRNKTENGMYSKMETLKDDDSNKTVIRPIPMIRCVFIPGGKVFQICGPLILKEERPKCCFTFGNIQSR